MRSTINKIWSSKFWWLLLIIIIIAVNFIASVFHSRIDLTKEKRYTLSSVSKELIRNLEETVYVDVFIERESLPSEVRKLRNTLEEFLSNCKEYNHENFQFSFFNPYAGLNDSLQLRMEDSLNYFYDLFPSILDAPEKIGDKLEITKLIHGAVVRYKDTSIGINLLQGLRNFGTTREQQAELYNNMEATFEYKFIHAVQKITSRTKPVIGYALGHGEAFGYNINDAFITLRSNYFADTINIPEVQFIPSQLDALVIMKPTRRFTDIDKLKIDQYIMRGGKVFWMIDNMFAEFDSLYNSNGFVAFDRGLDLEDILFRYGVRINQNLLQDIQCDKLGQFTGDKDNPQQRLVDWPFFPILNGTNHPICKNLDGIRSMFPNTIDTVKAAGISKTFLLKSSNNARVLSAPAKVDFEFLQIAPDERLFTVKEASVAVLLEGKFQSLFEGRVSKSLADSLAFYGIPYKSIAESSSKMIVVADGDIALNQISPQQGPLPMGYNLFTRYNFANKDFFLNSLEYLVNPTSIIETRSKEFTLRLLDPVKTKTQKTLWQLINIAAPVLFIILCGFIYQRVRKARYAS